MRVLVSPGKPVPIKLSRTAESHNSKTNCDDTEKIREERLLAKFVDQIEKMQQKTAQFNGAGRSLFANVDREDEDNDLLRKFFDEIDRDRPYCDTSSCVDPVLEGPKNDSLDAGLSQVSNNVSQSDMDFNRLTDDYAKENSKQSTWSAHEMGLGDQQNLAAPSGGLPLPNNQADKQWLLMLELQKKLHNFTLMIQQQQYRQKLGENEMREMQAQTAQESAVKETGSMPMQSENAETEIVSTNNSPPLCVLNQLNPVGGLESTQQCNQERTITRSIDEVAVDAEQTSHLRKESQHSGQTNRVDKSNGSLRRKKQVRVKRSDVAAEKDRVVRGKSKTYSCAECDREFNHRCYLIRHFRIHSGEKPFKCGECGIAFRQKSHLTNHQRIHTGAKPFECRICNVAFSHKTNLSCHLLIHTNEKPFSCDICKKSFRQKGVLSDHMNIHSGNWPYKCNVCHKTFRQRPNLFSHRKIHAKEDE